MSELPNVVIPHCEMPKLLRGQKALVTGGSMFIDGGMCLYPGFQESGYAMGHNTDQSQLPKEVPH